MTTTIRPIVPCIQNMESIRPKVPKLPFLPGLTPRSILPPESSRKRYFDVINGVCCVRTHRDEIPEYSAEDMEKLYTARTNRQLKTEVVTHEERRELRNAQRNAVTVRNPPTWIKHDRQVLRFFGYFQEAVHVDPQEHARIRPITLSYFLEDGTMKVFEPTISNSGLSQGTFVKRHEVPHPDGGVYVPHHFKLGTEVVIYCRSFQLVNCDEFTKWYFRKNNLDIGTPTEIPEDRFAQKRHDSQLQRLKSLPQSVVESKEYMELRYGAVRKNTKLKQHLENDLRVLRFYAYWDDPTLYGTRMYFIVHYFLSDDTLEVRHKHEKNQGCVVFPVFFARNRVSKKLSVMPVPSMDERLPDWVTPNQLLLGKTFPLCGRDLFLYDCDEFTRKFYLKWLKIEQIPIQLHHDDVPPTRKPRSEDDSKPKDADAFREAFKEILELGDKSLKFEATLGNSWTEDLDRRFVVMYYPSDFSVAVFEKRQRNSGHVEGKFADRRKVKNPETNKLYSPAEFYVGASISVNSAKFFLARADEFTLALMEEHIELFPYSDVARVTMKISNLKNDEDLTTLQSISPSALSELIRRKGACLNHECLVDHELVTLVRSFPHTFDGPKSGHIDVMSLCDMMRNPSEISR